MLQYTAMEFLCVVIDSKTNATLAEYEIAASNEPFAKWKAGKLFRADNRSANVDWTVDALLLD